MQKNDPNGPGYTLDAICAVAQAIGTTPPQRLVAEHMGVTRQYVSKMMAHLEIVGAIYWIDRTTYSVTGGTWEPPIIPES